MPKATGKRELKKIFAECVDLFEEPMAIIARRATRSYCLTRAQELIVEEDLALLSSDQGLRKAILLLGIALLKESM